MFEVDGITPMVWLVRVRDWKRMVSLYKEPVIWKDLVSIQCVILDR